MSEHQMSIRNQNNKTADQVIGRNNFDDPKFSFGKVTQNGLTISKIGDPEEEPLPGVKISNIIGELFSGDTC